MDYGICIYNYIYYMYIYNLRIYIFITIYIIYVYIYIELDNGVDKSTSVTRGAPPCIEVMFRLREPPWKVLETIIPCSGVENNIWKFQERPYTLSYIIYIHSGFVPIRTRTWDLSLRLLDVATQSVAPLIWMLKKIGDPHKIGWNNQLPTKSPMLLDQAILWLAQN